MGTVQRDRVAFTADPMPIRGPVDTAHSAQGGPVAGSPPPDSFWASEGSAVHSLMPQFELSVCPGAETAQPCVVHWSCPRLGLKIPESKWNHFIKVKQILRYSNFHFFPTSSESIV